MSVIVPQVLTETGNIFKKFGNTAKSNSTRTHPTVPTVLHVDGLTERHDKIHGCIFASHFTDYNIKVRMSYRCTNSESLHPTPHPIHMRMFTHAHAYTNPHTHTHMQGETDQLNSWTNATMSIHNYTCAHTRIYPEICASNMPNGVQMRFSKTT